MFVHRIKREKREAAICLSLVTRLKEAVQSVLQPGGSTREYGPRYLSQACHGPVLGHSDNTNALCNVLESIFIHGLRDSFSEKMSVLLGADPDRMPVPNFWPVVLIISHRDLIEQVSTCQYNYCLLLFCGSASVTMCNCRLTSICCNLHYSFYVGNSGY